ncbi:MAG: two-component regulator propeller domain-containing protein, partial [Bacteroidota bacterium]
MALKNTILYLLVIALNCNILEAQHYNVSVQHLGVTDGLSSRFINDIFQDSEGFIWLATNHGVNRYDAYEFKVLNQGKKYRKIAEDGHGDLWLVQDHHSGEQINRKIEILQKSTNRLIPLNEKLENCCDSLGINLVQNVGKTIWLKTMTGQMYSFYRELKQEVGLSRHTNTKTLIAGNENFPDQLWVIDQYRMKLVHRDGHILEADSVGSDQLISNPLFQADGSLHFVYHTIPHQEKYSFIKRQGEKIQPLHVFELAHRVNFKLYVEFPILQKYNDGIGLNWIWLGSRLLARD